MSWSTSKEPTCTAGEIAAIDLTIRGRDHDLGDGFMVRRVLPALGRQMVGPFIFFDEMGPGDLAPGEGLDVRPHPHIGLATVTYLFEGEVDHRDSLGIHQTIRPGAVNWMTAGRGIVHSERSGPEFRERGGCLHGIQLWIALPDHLEGCEPAFFHHPADTLPRVSPGPGVDLRVLLGEGYGVRSPVAVASPSFYAEAQLAGDARLTLPAREELPERAVYVVRGGLRCGHGPPIDPGTMVLFEPEGEVTLRAAGDTLLMILAGAPIGRRYIYWNLVASSRERLEEAKEDWREGRFPTVPGDEEERIPLPE